MVPSTPERERDAGRERRPGEGDEAAELLCVDCCHFAEFTCACCQAPVCLCHRTGTLGELCLCRECSPLAIRILPLREAFELVGLATLVSWALIYWLGYGPLSVALVFIVLVMGGTPLRMWQNQRREVARAVVAATPPLAEARALPGPSQRLRWQLPERVV